MQGVAVQQKVVPFMERGWGNRRDGKSHSRRQAGIKRQAIRVAGACLSSRTY